MNLKKWELLIIGVSLSFAVNAQIRVEAGSQINAPTESYFSCAIGGYVEAEYNFMKSLEAGLYIGAQHILMTDDWQKQWKESWGYSYKDADETLFPVKVSLLYHFSVRKFQPYAGIETGITKFHTVYSYYDSAYGWLTNNYSESHFTLSARAGFYLKMTQHAGVDLNVRYNGLDLNYLSASAGIFFQIGNEK